MTAGWHNPADSTAGIAEEVEVYLAWSPVRRGFYDWTTTLDEHRLGLVEYAVAHLAPLTDDRLTVLREAFAA